MRLSLEAGVVMLDGDTVVVGVYDDDGDDVSDAGAVCIFGGIQAHHRGLRLHRHLFHHLRLHLIRLVQGDSDGDDKI